MMKPRSSGSGSNSNGSNGTPVTKAAISELLLFLFVVFDAFGVRSNLQLPVNCSR